ncbi:MAG: glycosyl hydrolase family 18 protein [Niabella sp.]
MRKLFCLSAAVFLLSFMCLAQKRVVVAYVTSWTKEMPNSEYVTHVNYAFGHVNDSLNGVRIDDPERLKTIAALKASNKNLRVLLSVGGWGSGRFSEMAADKGLRKHFAGDCARIIDKFRLDGIDIDWEYPTSNVAGISASPDDTKNFTLLMRDIRSAIGYKRILTLASVAHGGYIDFKFIKEVVNFVNIMTYDSDNPPKHHAALIALK